MPTRTKNPVVDTTGETCDVPQLAHWRLLGAAYALLDDSCTYKEGPDHAKKPKGRTIPTVPPRKDK